MSKKIKGILVILALIFLFQTFTSFSILPAEKVLWLIYGISNIPRIFIMSVFVAIPILLSFSFILELMYSLGFKKKITSGIFKKYLKQVLILFFSTWITGFTMGIFVITGIFSNPVNEVQILNLYIFWYILINILFFSQKKILHKIENNKNKFIDDRRINYFSKIFGLNEIQNFTGQKGEVVYRESVGQNISNFLISTVATFLFFLCSLVTLYACAKVINGAAIEPESARPLALFFVGMISLVLIVLTVYFLGRVLSKKIILYKNCVTLPFATFFEYPLFTLLFPQSSVCISFEHISSCKIKKKRKHNESHFDKIILYLKNGKIFVLKPTELDIPTLEKAFKRIKF